MGVLEILESETFCLEVHDRVVERCREGTTL